MYPKKVNAANLVSVTTPYNGYILCANECWIALIKVNYKIQYIFFENGLKSKKQITLQYIKLKLTISICLILKYILKKKMYCSDVKKKKSTSKVWLWVYGTG